MKLTLPDCQGYADPFTLSAEDRRELVRRIAEKGASAIDEFIAEREAMGDSTIARKVAKLREELLERAKELKRRLLSEFGEKAETLEAEYKRRIAQLQNERDGLSSELGRVGPDFDAALRADPLFVIALDKSRAARAPWWRKLLAFFARILHWLLTPIRFLFGKRKTKRPDTIAIESSVGTTLLDQAGSMYLADPNFRRAAKAKLRQAPPAERIRRAWERMLGLEDYETLARKAMEMMMAEDRDRAQRASEERQQSLQQKLAQIVDAERSEQARRASAEQNLRQEQEREMQRLEEALRNAPEREVKEAIVDELKAAGLLRGDGDALSPTLQLLDRFAGLVYEDETRSMGAGRGIAAGEYAEGEGHYIRGPMRHAVEASRMDILASRIRARSRHPNVKHIMDDDVVVHREERTSTLHVVLIVDRSGSMEENGRLDAAKRATLALHHAVRARNPRNRVDILLMDTSVRAATLRDVWDTEPTGFTNTGGALRLTRELARRRKSDRLLVYLITDGLPEAYTKEGVDVAGHPDKAMEFAKAQAKLLRRERALAGFVMLLLEPENERHVKAATALAKECGGRVVDVDPKKLAQELLKSFSQPDSVVQ